VPSVAAAREFVALEPNNRAGVYRKHLLWRFENLLGRSMWEFASQATEPRFLIIGRSQNGRAGLGASPRSRSTTGSSAAGPDAHVDPTDAVPLDALLDQSHRFSKAP
jgi:hypothetical protein